MSKTALPKEIVAKWIWDESLVNSEDSYIFARKEFTLSQSGVYAQFWISANYSYQLFVNGRFIGCGPSPAPPGISYVDYYDLSYYMLTGKNVVSIVAHHTKFPTYSDAGKQPGLWCQLNVDDTPKVATDSNWKIHRGDCYQQSRPRRGQFLEFSEVCDLTRYPRGWRGENFLELDWEYCNCDISVEEFPSKLEAMPFDTPEFEELQEEWDIVSKGTIDPRAMLGQIHFSDVISNSGVYGAKSYIHCREAEAKQVKLYSDSACRVFINDKLLMDYTPDKSINFKEYTIDLVQGWNEILLIQYTTPSDMGALLSFPEERKGNVKFHTEPQKGANDGWKVYGPFRKKFSEIASSFTDELLFIGESRTERAMVNDAQAYLDGCKIESRKPTPADSTEPILHRYEFYVFDAGKLHYGFPGITITGKVGDIVDISYGETLSELKTPKNNDNFRSSDSLKIRSGKNNWMKFEPTCFRYVMVSTRRCVS